MSIPCMVHDRSSSGLKQATCHAEPPIQIPASPLPAQEDASSSYSVLTNTTEDDAPGSGDSRSWEDLDTNDIPSIIDAARIYFEAAGIPHERFTPPAGRQACCGCSSSCLSRSRVFVKQGSFFYPTAVDATGLQH